MHFSSLQMPKKPKTPKPKRPAGYFPFPTPLRRPRNATPDEREAWVAERMPYARQLDSDDWTEYQLVRSQVNNRASYLRRSKDPLTGEAFKKKNALKTKVIILFKSIFCI